MVLFNNLYTSESGAGEITLVLNISLKPGEDVRFLEQVALSVPKNRAEAGNLSFTVFKVDGLDNEYVMVERWKSKAAFDWHMEQDYAKAMFEVMGATMATPLAEALSTMRSARDLFPGGSH